jgi:hypothetical protein
MTEIFSRAADNAFLIASAIMLQQRMLLDNVDGALRIFVAQPVPSRLGVAFRSRQDLAFMNNVMADKLTVIAFIIDGLCHWNTTRILFRARGKCQSDTADSQDGHCRNACYTHVYHSHWTPAF